MPSLSYDGEGTAIIYGFLNQIFYFQGFDKADRIIFCWDSKFSKRTDLFPKYKYKRRQDKANYTEEEKVAHKSRHRQFKLLRTRILPALGFNNIFYQEGYEGDDMVASTVINIPPGVFAKIIARDKDLFQLITNNVTMYDWIEGRVITMEWLYENYGVYPDLWPDIMALSGCSTDEVPGISGIGKTSAIKFLTAKLKHSTKAYQKIVNGCDEIELSRILTTLPFEGANVYKVRKDECQPSMMKHVARQYGLNSYLNRLAEFKELFCASKA